MRRSMHVSPHLDLRHALVRLEVLHQLGRGLQQVGAPLVRVAPVADLRAGALKAATFRINGLIVKLTTRQRK